MGDTKVPTYSKSNISFTSDKNLIGFWGTQSNGLINSLGVITINTTCANN
jgi:hypothetical protein